MPIEVCGEVLVERVDFGCERTCHGWRCEVLMGMEVVMMGYGLLSILLRQLCAVGESEMMVCGWNDFVGGRELQRQP